MFTSFQRPRRSRRRGDTKMTELSAGARLHVGQDPSGAYVYRLVEASADRLLAELPRERAQELNAREAWASGAPSLDAARCGAPDQG